MKHKSRTTEGRWATSGRGHICHSSAARPGHHLVLTVKLGLRERWGKSCSSSVEHRGQINNQDEVWSGFQTAPCRPVSHYWAWRTCGGSLAGASPAEQPESIYKYLTWFVKGYLGRTWEAFATWCVQNSLNNYSRTVGSYLTLQFCDCPTQRWKTFSTISESLQSPEEHVWVKLDLIYFRAPPFCSQQISEGWWLNCPVWMRKPFKILIGHQ